MQNLRTANGKSGPESDEILAFEVHGPGAEAAKALEILPTDDVY